MRHESIWIYVLGAAALIYLFRSTAASDSTNQVTWQPAGGINPVLATLAPQYLPQCPAGEQLGWNSAGVPSCVETFVSPTVGIS